MNLAATSRIRWGEDDTVAAPSVTRNEAEAEPADEAKAEDDAKPKTKKKNKE